MTKRKTAGTSASVVAMIAMSSMASAQTQPVPIDIANAAIDTTSGRCRRDSRHPISLAPVD
jgi:hypothetical protein